MTRYGMVDRRHQVRRLLQLLHRLQGRVLRAGPARHSAAQPMTGQDWMKIVDRGARPVPQGQAGLHRGALHAVRRRRLRGGPTDGAVYKRADGIVMIDPEKAAGQGRRHRSAPTGIYWNEAEAGRSEVHLLRSPAGRRLERAPLRGGLPHRP